MELQRARLHFATPGGPLGELDVDADTTMRDLLFQLLLCFGKRPPLRLVRGKDFVVFAIGDRVMQVLPGFLPPCPDGDTPPLIELTLISLSPKEVRPKKTEIEGFQKITNSRWLWEGKGGGKGGARGKKGKGGGESEDQRLLNAWARDAARNGPRTSLDAFPLSALMEAGADIDYRCEQRETSYRDPGSHGEDKVTGESVLYSAVMKGDEAFVRLLIEFRAEVDDPQAFDMYDPGYNALQIKETVLHAAVKRGNANICRMLLEAKACANRGLTQYSGERPWEMGEKTSTPLYVAAQKEGETQATELCRMLLDYRADPNQGLVDAYALPGPRARTERPASAAKSQKCKELLRKASELGPCCDAARRGGLCQICGTSQAAEVGAPYALGQDWSGECKGKGKGEGALDHWIRRQYPDGHGEPGQCARGSLDQWVRRHLSQTLRPSPNPAPPRHGLWSRKPQATPEPSARTPDALPLQEREVEAWTRMADGSAEHAPAASNGAALSAAIGDGRRLMGRRSLQP